MSGFAPPRWGVPLWVPRPAGRRPRPPSPPSRGCAGWRSLRRGVSRWALARWAPRAVGGSGVLPVVFVVLFVGQHRSLVPATAPPRLSPVLSTGDHPYGTSGAGGWAPCALGFGIVPRFAHASQVVMLFLWAPPVAVWFWSDAGLAFVFSVAS